MATGKQHVKTPSGWNATQGAWVKTGGTTWKAADQIYVKTPGGWNNASGQTSVQQPYPYIANSQTPYIANAQQPYPYIANSQTPYIANAQNPYPYIANSQTPYIANAQTPYPYIANSQTPYIANAQQPYPYIANSQTPYIANAQQPYPYIANARQPYIANAQAPFTYNATYPANARQPSNAQSPFTYNARYPANAQSPSNGQNPFTYNARYPANATYPANEQNPFTYNARTPFTYQARTPFTYRVPYIANARQPYIANARGPTTYQHRNPFTYPFSSFPFGGGGGCFIAGTQIWMADNTHTNIENVVVGDSVMTFDFNHMKLMPQNVITVMVPRENIKVWNVELSNGKTLGVTGGHPIHTDSGWRYTNQEECDNELNAGADWGVELSGVLEIGDKVFTVGEEIVTVKSIEENGTATVYHLTSVEHTNTYFTEGVLVHNGYNQKH